MKIPITQSKKWQELQNDLKEESFFEKTEEFQYLAILKKTPVGNYLFCPYGPVTDNEKSFKKACDSLEKLGREKHAIFIRIEPQIELKRESLPKKAYKTKDIDPADTWVLNLTDDEATIIKNFSQGTRTRYNNYARKGIKVEATKDTDKIRHLVDLQAKLFDKKHLTVYSPEYLKTELAQPFATLYLVKYDKSADETLKDNPEPEKLPKDGQVLAASLFFDFDGVRYYMQSAADGDFKRLPATVALLTKAIFDAKNQGIKEFDFWGIAPEGADSSHPWAGFTEFKKSFGGNSRHYTGTYDIVLSPIRYRLFKSAKKLHL